GGQNSITIGQNGTFTLTLGITTNFISRGYSVFYQSNNGQGLFQITGRTSLDPLYPFPVPDTVPFPILLNPSDPFDLGSAGNGPVMHPPGTFNLQSVTINLLNAPIGTYTIFLDSRSIMTDLTFNDVAFGGATGPMFTVNVIPEPTTIGLLAMAGAVVSVVAWRKRRA
ncbi:MAG: PEP-CTERM sorting domain-containing protein, partial [Chthoniobacterales bacterium]